MTFVDVSPKEYLLKRVKYLGRKGRKARAAKKTALVKKIAAREKEFINAAKKFR